MRFFFFFFAPHIIYSVNRHSTCDTIDRAANRVLSFLLVFFKHLILREIDIDMQAPAPKCNGDAL